MTEKNLVSSHHLNRGSYEGIGKWKGVIQGWIVFLAIYLITRIPAVQGAMTGFADWAVADWVKSGVPFIINYWLWLGLPMLIGTVMVWRKKMPFTELRVYPDGIGFVINGRESFVPHEQVYFSYGSMHESLWIGCGVLGISRASHLWQDFSQPDVLENNLQRYANWDIAKYQSK
ncbi:hypothetical protein [Prevotella sp. KH2C16]|uniref:hypothetical protein n=1 Tax=Prevotella sp. KH2C16 TaxID=1855325 RepID=UPI0008F235CA|nr:hypothetical protein [Prevotella sp. KH2C16]SFG46302.1 hypothetical protein SAMN05216383_11539 [Prevotella sp. KH2C16]